LARAEQINQGRRPPKWQLVHVIDTRCSVDFHLCCVQEHWATIDDNSAVVNNPEGVGKSTAINQKVALLSVMLRLFTVSLTELVTV
jgi:hypothetical protein